MRQDFSEQAKWAMDEFGQAALGDGRRTTRVLNMATRAAQRPGGKITDVFSSDRERQGAYDLLEGKHVDASALSCAAGRAAARRATSEVFSFVAIDGSSISPTDETGSKGFGSVGNLVKGGRGLKVINAVGLTPEGVPLGMFAQVWWPRLGGEKRTKREKKKHVRRRDVSQKETWHWLTAIKHTVSRADDVGAKLWFLLDREADNLSVLLALSEKQHRFTIRNCHNRRLELERGEKQYLRDGLAQSAVGGSYSLQVPSGPHRSARLAHMVVRWKAVTLRVRDDRTGRCQPLRVNTVWTREVGTCPHDEQPLDWLLLTNSPVVTFEDAQHVIYGYSRRWRVEDLHKTWKSGACNVEQTQLRSLHAVTVWATILASVAVRIERLKLLSRTKPDEPATLEFSESELRALILIKRQNKKRTEVIADTLPSISQATTWVAELGGYTGKSSGGPPGSITIRRGLERLELAAQVYAALAPPDK